MREYESLMPFPVPLKLWFGTGAPRQLFYFTKPTFINFLWRQALFPADWLAIERASVPTVESLDATRYLAEGFGLPVVFVGDIKPIDLTVFALLRRGSTDFSRRRAKPIPVHYAGLDDEWLAISDEMRLPGIAMPKHGMRSLEQEHHRLLRRLVPDLEELIGKRSFSLLESGQQVHMEMTFVLSGYRKGLAVRLSSHLRSAANRAVRRMRTR